MKVTLTNLSLIILFVLSAQAQTMKPTTENEKSTQLQAKTFLKPSQLQDLFNQLINFIETYDAEGIETRKLTKQVNWVDYKQKKQVMFINSKNWQELKKGFEQLTAGFVNLHSHFKFNKSFVSKPLESSVKIGFTYPEISFFDLNSQEIITQFNQLPSLEVFNEFEQYNCPYNSQIGCLRHFVNGFSKGELTVNNHPIDTISKANLTININYHESTMNKKSDMDTDINISLYGDGGWQVLEKGHKVAILQKHNMVLLVIKNFIYPNGTDESYRCIDSAEANTMCADIQLIRHSFNKLDVDEMSLIIDVQNNIGGNENTPFLAELSQAPFKDLMVKYKNTSLLHNAALRQGLFYGSSRAENWYQQLTTKEKDLQNEWLPVRADFCQSDENCQLKWIEPNSNRKFKSINIITNERCASSCDDLIWRLNEYSGAKVFGLPQAADATYSRISATFYIDKNNDIKLQTHPDGSKPKINGTQIFSITIPYSRTVTSSGAIRQGKPALTKLLLPITTKNFLTHAVDSVNYLAKQLND